MLILFVQDMYKTTPEIPESGRLTRDQLDLLGRALHVPLQECSVQSAQIQELNEQAVLLWQLRKTKEEHEAPALKEDSDQVSALEASIRKLEASIRKGVQSLNPNELFREGLKRFKVEAAKLLDRLQYANSEDDLTMFAQQVFGNFPLYLIWNLGNVNAVITYILAHGPALIATTDESSDQVEATLFRRLFEHINKCRDNPDYADDMQQPILLMKDLLDKTSDRGITSHHVRAVADALIPVACRPIVYIRSVLCRPSWDICLAIEVKATYEEHGIFSVEATNPYKAFTLFNYNAEIERALRINKIGPDDMAQDDKEEGDKVEDKQAEDDEVMFMGEPKASEDKVVCTGESFDLMHIDG